MRTNKQTNKQTNERTNQRTNERTNQQTNQPTNQPTNEPTNQPTNQPTDRPTDRSTNRPTDRPTDQPTGGSTQRPDLEKTHPRNGQGQEREKEKQPRCLSIILSNTPTRDSTSQESLQSGLWCHLEFLYMISKRAFTTPKKSPNMGCGFPLSSPFTHSKSLHKGSCYEFKAKSEPFSFSSQLLVTSVAMCPRCGKASVPSP